MTEYIYKTILYRDTTNVIGLNVTQNNIDLADFEANYKASSTSVDSIVIMETTFQIDKTYTQFKALVDGATILWSDVRFVKDPQKYCLYLVTDSPL